MFGRITTALGAATLALGMTAGAAAADPYYGGYGYGHGGFQPVGYYDDGYYDADCHRRSSGDEVAATLFGAIIGGVIGGQFGNDGDDQAAAAIAGALIGGFAGNRLTANLRCDDYYYADDAYYRGFEGRPGRRYDWRNPHSGNYGYVQPVGDYYAYGRYRTCREYTQTIYIDGRRQTARGTACRGPDGTWQIID